MLNDTLTDHFLHELNSIKQCKPKIYHEDLCSTEGRKLEKENIWPRKENRKEKEGDKIWGRDFLSEKETEKGGKYV